MLRFSGCFCFDLKAPALLVTIVFLHGQSIRNQMACRQGHQVYVPVDAASGIPPAVGAPVPDMDHQFVSARTQFSVQRNVKCGISVGMAAEYFSVEQHVAVHIDAVKAEHHHRFMVFGQLNRPPVPCVSGFIQVVLPYQPVMGQVHRRKSRVLRIFQHGSGWKLGKGPLIVDQCTHLIPLLSVIRFSGFCSSVPSQRRKAWRVHSQSASPR